MAEQRIISIDVTHLVTEALARQAAMRADNAGAAVAADETEEDSRTAR